MHLTWTFYQSYVLNLLLIKHHGNLSCHSKLCIITVNSKLPVFIDHSEVLCVLQSLIVTVHERVCLFCCRR